MSNDLVFPRNSCDPLGRRAFLRFGLAGFSSWQLARLRTELQAAPGQEKRRNHSCVFIFLFGGPSHIDLWDMKPAAPVEVRGDFQPIATNVSGIQICEHLPKLAASMDKLCLLRSMTHRMPVHGPACSEIYSGRPYFGPPVTDQATPEDWPSLAAMLMRFSRQPSILPHSIVLPWYTHFVGQDRRIAGQTGGRMGEEYNPFLIEGDLTGDDFRVRGLDLPDDVSVERFRRRRDLRSEVQRIDRTRIPAGRLPALLDANYHKAFTLVEQSKAVGAFDLGREPGHLRQRYGKTHFGQSLLLARRLVEAQVPLVTVNWNDNHRDDKVSPHWDTHVQNFPKLKDRLCPPFDRELSTFVEDLHDRGLLETTLVIAVGEFGRSPKIGVVTQNGMTEKTGRDHWPHAFTVLLAGGGVRGGQVFGSTVDNGGYVKDSPVTPADLTATILHHLGVDLTALYDDHFLQIEQRLCTGRPIRNLG